MPFKPRYRITDKVLNKISQITAGRGIIEHSKLIPKWEMKLRKEARLHNAHSSTSIEGNKLTLEQVKALSEHKEVVATAKDKKEVSNYLQALDAITKYSQQKTISIKLFLNIHRRITREVLEDTKDCGVFRKRQVFVGKRVFDGTGIKEVIEYEPPDAKAVPGLVKEFLYWLNSAKIKDINPVILSGVVHYGIAGIHPFIGGNGRVARLLASLILYRTGFDHRRFFALDDYYDRDRNAYYAALKTVQKSKGDLTQWLEYFVEGVLYSVTQLKETILRLGIVPKQLKAEQIELSQKQIEILEKMRERNKVTNKDLRVMFKVSRQAILKEIKKLLVLDVIELVGKGRGAYYKIKE